MITVETARHLIDGEVLDRYGDTVGKVGQVYLDDDSGQPTWATVRTGLFGLKESFVPLEQATLDGRVLRVPMTKDEIRNAPRIDADAQEIPPQEEQALYRYYGLDGAAEADGRPGRPEAGRARGRDGALVRSEERLNVGTERVEAGRVRLRKYVVTERQQVDVPVRREEVRLERTPIDPTDRDRMGDTELGDGERVETLHAERPVVTTEAVPVEQVRLSKQTVTDTQTVSGDVRKERIEVDDDAGLLADRRQHGDRRHTAR